MNPYNAAKGAVVNLTRAPAMDIGKKGVRVNFRLPQSDAPADPARARVRTSGSRGGYHPPRERGCARLFRSFSDAAPDRKTSRGRHEYALLLFLYNTGARVFEVTQLKVRDLKFGRGSGGHDLATLHGKGGKTRQCPLWPETERVLASEILDRAADAPCLSAGLERSSLASGSTGASNVAQSGLPNWRAEQ
jgi:Phage integrase family